MDGDDISLPSRIEEQFNFMEEHPFCRFGSLYSGLLGLENNYDILLLYAK
jgi:hypothetical protein